MKRLQIKNIIIILLFVIVTAFLATKSDIKIVMGLIGVTFIIWAFRKYPVFFIVILIFINEKYMSFPNVESASFPHLLYPPIVFLGLTLLIFGLYFISKLSNSDELAPTRQPLYFRYEVILFIILAFVEVINTHLLFNHDIALGVFENKSFFSFLLYFPVVDILRNEKNRNQFMNIIVGLAIVVALLNIIQFVLWNQVTIFALCKEVMSSVRQGSARFLAGENLLYFSIFIIIQKILNSPQEKLHHSLGLYLGLLVILAAIIVVGKTRMIIFGLIIAILFVYLVQKNWRHKKYFIFGLMIIAIGLSFSENNLITALFSSASDEIKNNSGNYNYRLLEVEFYLNQLSGRWMLGVGRISYHYKYLIDNVYGEKFPFWFSDVGVLGYVFIYGLIGLFILGLLFFKCFRILNHIKKDDNSFYAIMGYFVFALAIFPTIPLYVQNEPMLYLVILLALINHAYSKKQALAIGTV